MARWDTLKKRYPMLHRFLSGITVTCIILTIIGSKMAGATYPSITFRALLVGVVLLIAGRFIVKMWNSLEEVRHGVSKPRKAK